MNQTVLQLMQNAVQLSDLVSCIFIAFGVFSEGGSNYFLSFTCLTILVMADSSNSILKEAVKNLVENNTRFE